MLAPNFRLEVNSTAGSQVVSVVGEVDIETASLFASRLTQLIDEGSRRIVVDLSATSFMDSTGLSVLVQTLTRMRSLEGEFLVRSPHSSVSKLLQITGLETLIPQE